MMRFEISYERADRSGSKFVLARTDDEALAKFREQWEEFGDPAPSAWVSGRYAMD